MRCNDGIDQLAAMRLQRRDGLDLVDAHQSAVTDNIGCEDRREPAFHLLSPQAAPSCKQSLPRRAIDHFVGQFALALTADQLPSVEKIRALPPALLPNPGRRRVWSE